MIQRQTVVIHGRLAADRVRLDAARNGHHGLQVTTVVGMASRLAGGFLRGVDGDTLARLFVTCQTTSTFTLGASSLTYAEATWTQTLPDWIGAHVRMFRFWGASPRLLVPDNLKSAVHKASFCDPEVECGVRKYMAFGWASLIAQRIA
jgi:hypothetical protein